MPLGKLNKNYCIDLREITSDLITIILIKMIEKLKLLDFHILNILKYKAAEGNMLLSQFILDQWHHMSWI